MQTTLLLLRDASWLLYAGPMIGFTLLICVSNQENKRVLVNSFQLFGPIFGISLGTCIFAALGLEWITYEDFSLRWENSREVRFSIGVLVGFAMWISNFILEIWTLDPFRKISAETTAQNMKSLIQKLKGHLLLHTSLIIAITILCGF